VEPVEAKAFDESEVQEVMARYPGLRQAGAGALEGVIEIHHQHGAVVRQDSFSIRLTAHNGTSRLPALREVGGRSKAIVLRHGLEDVRALHQNLVEGTACVCIKQEEAERFPPGARLLTFVDQLAIPYLYGLSYLDEFGKWPWGEYNHGGLGLLEFYADNPGQGTKQEFEEVLASLRAGSDWPDYHRQLRKPSSKRACICGSGKAFGKCHRRAWRGLKSLASALARVGLNPKSLPK
jgi:hypothetical protein